LIDDQFLRLCRNNGRSASIAAKAADQERFCAQCVKLIDIQRNNARHLFTAIGQRQLVGTDVNLRSPSAAASRSTQLAFEIQLCACN